MPSRTQSGGRNGLGGCPSTQCSGGSPGRQSELTEAQIERIDDVTKKDIEQSGATLYRCSYCGAVYNRWTAGKVLGFLDNAMLGDGWHPS
jgi:hypothetical protein